MVQGFTKENLAIVIFCRDRLKYLVHTWNSLVKTVEVPYTISVYDDCSEDEELLRFLQSSDEFLLKSPIDINCGVLKKYIGDFPIIEKVKGIGNKIILRRQEQNIGNSFILFKAVREIFEENPDVQYILRLEDDIVFKEGWLEILLSKWNEWSSTIINPGILCGCMIQNPDKREGEITTIFCPSFQCVLIPRYLYDIDKEWFNGPWKFKTKCDLYMEKYCRESGFACGLLQQSICQHIGVDSVELQRYDEYFSKGYDFSQRMDSTVFPPFIY